MMRMGASAVAVVVLAARAAGAPAPGGAGAPVKEPGERLAPVAIEGEAANAAASAHDAFRDEVEAYRGKHKREAPDEGALKEIQKHYDAQRAAVDRTVYDALLTYTYASALAHHGRNKEVVALYEEAIKRFDGSAEAARLRVNLGKHLLDRMGDAVGAAKVYGAIAEPPAMRKEANGIDPWLITRDAYERARIDLLRCQLREGKVREAEEAFGKLETAMPRMRALYTQECDAFDEDLKKAREKKVERK